MPLSARKLKTYQKYYKVNLHPIREFDSTHHPVVLMRESLQDNTDRKDSWLNLVCPCDLTWRWEIFGKPPRRTMVMTGDGFSCTEKERAREVIREEARAKYAPLWSSMSLTDAVQDIWQKHCAGEYMGEHNIGMLYVQDLERLLGTVPQFVSTDIMVCGGQRVEATSFSYPSKEILSAVDELRKRKLLDLSGMILVPYKESFRFPDELHHQFAYWIEEHLGAPNGDAGDCFLFDLYRKISSETGWASGEVVFGDKNIPNLSEKSTARVQSWLKLLDNRLVDKEVVDKSEILRGISIRVWKLWLHAIMREVSK